MTKILIVEDEKSLADVTCDFLRARDFTVDLAGDGDEAASLLKFDDYDLIVLDWTLPGQDGLAVLRQYRQRGGLAPVIMLTGKKEVEDKETGFDAGADDYLTKPFHLRELLARIKALLRRPRSQADNLIRAGYLEIDPDSRRVTRDGEELDLLPREFALILFLARNPGQVFSAEAIVQRVWPTDSDVSPSAVRIYITRLRKKIDRSGSGEPSLITTVHSVGYRLDI